MVRLYSISALIGASLFYAKHGNWDYAVYYLTIIPYRIQECISSPHHLYFALKFWVEEIVDEGITHYIKHFAS